MKRNILIRAIIVVVVLLVFTAGIFGLPKSWSGRGLQSAMLERINLGLDLKGGTHLVLQVVVDDAIRSEADRAVERLKEGLRQGNVTYAEVRRPDDRADRVVISGVAPESITAFKDVVADQADIYDLQSGADNAWTLTLKQAASNDLKGKAVAQAIETIRGRVDQLGVTEPVIQEHGLGEHQILVMLPGVDDPGRVKEIMQSTAMLEIRQAVGGPYSSQAAAQAGLSQNPDAIVLRGRTVARRAGDSTEEWYLLSRSAPVAGRDIRDAQSSRDQNGQPAVSFLLTTEAGRRFETFTSAHVNDQLAIVLDNVVREVARINEPIRDSVQISGAFTLEQTKDLSMMLRSGALPATIKYLEERTVGPSLGADSIRDGVRAGLFGLIAVMGFMLIYYKGAGINANLGLLLNVLILLGFMGFTGATLTLPGIAGFILTVGMGVDSNVLIFERIREELKAGKTPAQAVDQGFARAWLTIIDTHVTTIVSAAILFVFGSGPVRGFAVTLVFGLLANLFTAVFVSRVIFDYLLSRHRRGEALSI